MIIKWRSFNNTIGSDQSDIFVIEDKDIEEMRKAGYTEEAIEAWIDNEVKEEVVNYFEWSYEILEDEEENI